MRSGSAEKTYVSDQGGGVGGPTATGGMGEVDDGADVAAASWAAVRWGAGGSGGVGEEEMGLGAREVGAFFTLTANMVAKAVQVGRAATRWSSEPGLGRSGRGCRKSVLVVTVGRQAGRGNALG